MTLFGTRFHYGPIAQAFHWVMAVRDGCRRRRSPRRRCAPSVLHEAIGVTIFVMVAFRLWVADLRPAAGQAAERQGAARWSWAVDVALYVLLFAVPITGIIGAHEMQAVLASGRAQHPPGPSVLGLHRLFGILLVLTAGLHSAFALVHHYVRKDGVLAMMLPARRVGLTAPPRDRCLAVCRADRSSRDKTAHAAPLCRPVDEFLDGETGAATNGAARIAASVSTRMSVRPVVAKGGQLEHATVPKFDAVFVGLTILDVAGRPVTAIRKVELSSSSRKSG